MADRIKNNPVIAFTENESHGLKNITGSLDNGYRTGFAAEIVVIPNVGKEISGPKNKAPDWSA